MFVSREIKLNQLPGIIIKLLIFLKYLIYFLKKIQFVFLIIIALILALFCFSFIYLLKFMFVFNLYFCSGSVKVIVVGWKLTRWRVR